MTSLEDALAALDQSRREIRQYVLNQAARPFALVETTGHGEPKEVVAWGTEFPKIATVFFTDGGWGTFDSAEQAELRLARHTYVELVYLDAEPARTS